MTVTHTAEEFEPQLLDYLLMARDAKQVEIPAELNELLELRNTVDRPRMLKYVTRSLCLNLEGGRPRLEVCKGVRATDDHPANRLYVGVTLFLDSTKRTASSTELDIQLGLDGTLHRSRSLLTPVGRVETRYVWTRDRRRTLSLPNWDLPREPQDFVDLLLDWDGLSPLLLELIQELVDITSGA